jgi:methylglutaconyl-CoA hydratase
MKEIPPYKSILVSQTGNIVTVTLNRPEVHNAFNLPMVKEIYDIFMKLSDDNSVKCIVLTGNGKSFCAGADLNWFRDVSDKSYRDVYNEILLLAKLLYLIFTHPKPVIGRINGPAVGGGVGLAAVCDITIASESASFGLNEISIGIIPSIIAPYLIKRMGENATREYFLSGEKITAKRALELKLVNYNVEEVRLDDYVNEKAALLLNGAPNSIANTKQFFSEIATMRYDEILQYTSEVMAKSRISEEGIEGMSSFLEKRSPKWHIESV